MATRTYVVTGAASGIGKAIAQRLEGQGARVIGVDRVSVDVSSDDRSGGAIIADLAHEAGRTRMLEQVEVVSGGSVDAVIACAGIGGDASGPSADVIRVNYFGAVATLMGLRPLLTRADSPRAVVVASIGVTAAVHDPIVEACLAGDEPAAIEASVGNEQLAYTSTKRAIARWVRRSAPSPDWAGARIPLNAVGPGMVATPMTEHLLADPDMREMLMTRMPMPLGWPARPEQIAPALDWLSSADNSMITGQCLFVDGGLDALRRGDDIWP